MRNLTLSKLKCALGVCNRDIKHSKTTHYHGFSVTQCKNCGEILDCDFSSCMDGGHGEIFEEYWDDAIKAENLTEVMEYIKEIIVGDYYESCYDEDEITTDIKTIQTSNDPVEVIRAWNRDWLSNGETHGTIFYKLLHLKEFKLLEDCMKDLLGKSRTGVASWDS